VAITATGYQRLAEAECALAAAENEVLAALTGAERGKLYALLQKATAGHVVPGGC
jgi:predicted lactoylglutathione lyase